VPDHLAPRRFIAPSTIHGGEATESAHPTHGPMNPSEISGVLEFLRAAEQLKNTHRSAWTSGGEPESVAEHTWRLCLMAMLLKDDFPGVDFARLVQICIIHDLGEAISGDIPAIHQVPGQSKAADERADLLELLQPLPQRMRAEITGLWDEYEAAQTPEARLAKALDKLETILQHNQGRNPPDFDYGFNLQYGTRFTTGHPLIERIRALLDADTARRAEESSSP
jgi:putative hydrolase of HD superfamily